MENPRIMKKTYTLKSNKFFYLFLLLLTLGGAASAQPFCEWRLANAVFNPTDPDGGGGAVGTVSFTLQIRTITPGSTTQPVTAISTGYMYQSTKAMVPTTVNCLANSPANITISPEFAAGGFLYQSVNQCNPPFINISTGGQTFDRRAVDSLIGTNGVVITNAWVNVFTVTLWALSSTAPQGGYAAINATGGGNPVVGAFGTYSLADDFLGEYITNSLTFDVPLPLPTAAAPVLFSQFNATCSPNGTLISWKTAQESNSDYFEVQRSTDGSTWTSIGRTAAAGNSPTERSYNQVDLLAGNALYRIKQVDKDGQANYTTVKPANCQVKNITSLIYPVPAQNELNVVIRSDKAIRTQLVIFDAVGRAVKTENVNIQP